MMARSEERYMSHQSRAAALDSGRRLVTIDELCMRYPFKKWTIRARCSQGTIPHLKLGRSVFFDLEAIEAWLKAHERPAQEVTVG
jgi:excisionase family DNA binding protein